MTLDEAIDAACGAVGIISPKRYQMGRWAKTDTLAGKSGRGDGRVIVDEDRATAWNWQTGEKRTVWLDSIRTPEQRRDTARKAAEREREQRERAELAAGIAQRLISAASLAEHGYLISKGFREEKALTLGANAIRDIGGKYLVPDGGRHAMVIPARIAGQISSVQLIWESGTKKFLVNGKMEGARHRVSKGRETWLCEGYATAITLRAALQSLFRPATVLVCFSAANIVAVARTIEGPCFIAADHDKPIEQFDGLGTGEYYARLADKPYLMPEEPQTDINDLYVAKGIFAVQSLILSLAKRSGERRVA